jgi:hypothetical protein
MSFGSYRYSPASASALSDNIDTAIVAMGWTLHDTVAATDRVYYSQGESGAKTKEYIRVKVNSNNIEFYAYLFWDAATNTGYGQAYSSASYIYITWSSSTKWVISGDKDIVVICKVGASAGADFMFFGHLPTPLWSTPLATTSNAEVAGAGVVIEVSSTTDFVVNKAYLIVDPTTGTHPGHGDLSWCEHHRDPGQQLCGRFLRRSSSFEFRGYSDFGPHQRLQPYLPV